MKFLIFAIPLLVSAQSLRPPATPLIAHDPYFSVWSTSDRLTAEPTKHWTGTEQSLAGIARIDGKSYRFLGQWRRAGEAMRQTSLAVTPTRTTYTFERDGIELTLSFFTPAFAEDLDVLSRPLTYVSFDARAIDGKSHRLAIHFDGGAQLALNNVEQRSSWSRLRVDDLQVLRIGSVDQQVLGKSGDNLRIDWGYFYLAAAPQPGLLTLAGDVTARDRFLADGSWPESDNLEPPVQTSRNQPIVAVRFDLGSIGATPVSRWLMAAYDDLFSIQYFHRNLRPYWRRKFNGFDQLLAAAAKDYPALSARGKTFDADLTRKLETAGGRKYADIAVLAYRQALAAHKLVTDIDGTALYFSKENFSNGCIATVDVTYPSAPLFLWLSPELLRGMMTPIFDYAKLPRWPWPYAPHDLGTYPLANGQVYGGGEQTEDRQMPLEESGNMIILTAALHKRDGNLDYVRRYWPVLTKWAEYLKAKGMDPENQLNTDDFAGHSAHNANLSVKAIVALGAYAQLARALGHGAVADSYSAAARGMATHWMKMADDGDHYRLAFDQPGTWSQKYNLVWDKLLGLNLFPGEVARKEITYYKKMQKTYGLPLDSRANYTKLDWILWSATLAESREDFEAFVTPVHKFLHESESRVPMTDWYWTDSGKQRGFQARSVVGGVFLRMLQ
ncbi:MAG: DUF4965 domain-containing protein [Bryobacterales bacterium]|nr:DUF4965 domain-containing protein [Bryobacterales bacterium]